MRFLCHPRRGMARNWTDTPFFPGSESCAQPDPLNPVIMAAIISHLNALFGMVSFLPVWDTRYYLFVLLLEAFDE
jgi:hypothetical protein